MKTCAKCRQSKALADFHSQPSSKDGRHSWCKPCANTAQKASRAKNGRPKNKRRWLLNTRYRIKEAKVAAMVQEQGGVCAICGKEMKRPCIDHCHTTLVVRGVLCHRCNVGLHYVEDAAYRAAALAYLRKERR